MKEINAEELKEIQLKILETVDDFCRRKNINYFLDCGTLLGAIRHNGYIPWDDDIDIGMLRPEFDKFMREFNAENKKYQFFCIENKADFFFVHGKVLDTDTLLYEPDEKGVKIAVNIDVFVYDNAPSDPHKLKKMYNKRDLYRKLSALRNIKSKPNGNIFRRSVIRCLRGGLKIFPKNYFLLKLDRLSQKYSDQETGFVGNFTSFARICERKEIFDTYQEALFENKLYKIPGDYDSWLKGFYGNYMQLPPKEKQVTHHTFKAYKK